MGNTYYWDPAADYVAARTGAFEDELTGPGGFHALQTEYGAAPLVAAGDTVLCKAGACDLQRYVKITLDGQYAGWVNGVTVSDNNGGTEWTGVIVEGDEANPSILYVQLDSPFNIGDIIAGHGIYSSLEAAAGIAAVALHQLYVGETGSAGDGNIIFRGVDATWTEFTAEDDPMDFQVVFDGQVDGGATQATYCLYITTGPDFIRFENFTFQNASSHNVYFITNYCDYWVFDHCRFSASAGGSGLYANVLLRYATVMNCLARDNAGGAGFYRPGLYSSITQCVASGNSTEGANVSVHGISIDNSLFYDNDLDNIIVAGNGILIRNCVCDGSSAGSGVRIDSDSALVMGCRLTNNQYGIEQDTANECSIEDWNVFFGNAQGDLLNMVSGIHSYGDGANHIADPETDGYVDGSYNVASGAEHRNTAIVLNWDE